jgi:hypothetical protein
MLVKDLKFVKIFAAPGLISYAIASVRGTRNEIFYELLSLPFPFCLLPFAFSLFPFGGIKQRVAKYPSYCQKHTSLVSCFVSIFVPAIQIKKL